MNEGLKAGITYSLVLLGIAGFATGGYKLKRYIKGYKAENPEATTKDAIVDKIEELYKDFVENQYEISKRHIA